MPIYPFKKLTPQLGLNVFVAPSADLIGDLRIGDNVNIWYGTVLRGDVNYISVGENTNIQDLSMLHVGSNDPLIIGKNVTIGHQVNLHGCTIGDSCLIGIGATILDGAVIGENSVVAAGALVAPNKVYPPNSFIMGLPAKLIRELTAEEKIQYGHHYKGYLELASEYLNG